MNEAHPENSVPGEHDALKDREVRYPENRLVGLVDTPEQLQTVVEALTSNGFLRSEIEVVHGAAAADKMRANTGRTGFADLAMRFSEFIGVPNDEVSIKKQYADALSSGQLLITVLALSDARRQAGRRILGEHGASDVKFFGKHTIGWPAPAD